MRWLVVVGWVALATVALATDVDAAPRSVHGIVLVARSPEPIGGATILTDHGDIAATDADGYFAIALDPRDRAITVVASGYITRTVDAATDDMLHIELEKAQGAEVIEVYGRAPEETKPLSYELTADEIRSIPGAFNDVLRAAQVLPGVARIPYAFGGLVLRGTSPRDTQVYLDGIEVPIAFHFGGVTSFYPSGMLADLQLTAGGFDASYGRAQGGLVALTTREPRTDRWRVGGSIGLLDSSAWAEGPIWGGGGITIGIRRSYFDTVADPFVADDVPLPSYWDFQIRTSWGDPHDTGRISPMVFGSIDRVASNALSVTSAFVRIAAPYLRQWGPVTLRVTPWLGFNQLAFEEGSGGSSDTFSRPTVPGGVRAELTRDETWGHLRGGVETNAGYLARTQVNVQDQSGHMETNGDSTLSWVDVAAWTEARIRIDGDRFAIKPGLRLERYGLTSELVLDPRLNIHERLTDTLTLRQAIGRYHQSPTPADVDAKDGNPALEGSYTDQASLGMDKDFGDRASASITGFFDYGQRLGVRVQPPSEMGAPTPEPDYGGLGPTFELLLEKQLGFPIYRGNLGRARSYGLEVLLKRNTGRLFTLLSYTLSRSERTDDPHGTLDQLTRRIVPSLGWRPFELDQTHNLNVAVAYQLTHWRIGARVQIVSGNPYTPTTFDATTGKFEKIPWSGSLPTFLSLDLRADHRWHRCWGDIDLFIDIQNATNAANVEGREFDSNTLHDKDIPGLPVIPFIGVEFIPR